MFVGGLHLSKGVAVARGIPKHQAHIYIHIYTHGSYIHGQNLSLAEIPPVAIPMPSIPQPDRHVLCCAGGPPQETAFPTPRELPRGLEDAEENTACRDMQGHLVA